MLKKNIQKLYPPKAEEIYEKIQKLIHQYKKNSTIDTQNQRYKNMILYTTYPDSIYDEKGLTGFAVLQKKLDYIQNLGCNAIHILPPFMSSDIDRGFDITDYYTIKPEFGGNREFENFLDATKKRGIKVFVDLVLNHVSEQHERSLKAKEGNEYYQDFFITNKEYPPFLQTRKDKKAYRADYKYDNTIFSIPIMFPDQTGKIPHRTQKNDKRYYHTFYPQQLDLNYNNPEVLVHIAEVICFWTKKGLNFRLDALPYVGKQITKGVRMNSSTSHIITHILAQIAYKIDPNTVFLAEACIPPNQQKKYFGTKNNPGIQCAYDFFSSTALRESISTKNNTALKEYIQNRKPGPKRSQKITFLRNHDELSIEAINPTNRQNIVKHLKETGIVRREGVGIAGRTASFLQNNEEDIIHAFFLLFSLPGSPMIIYGDEIAKPSNTKDMDRCRNHKKQIFPHLKIAPDPRDSNRGTITPDELNDKEKSIYQKIQKIVKTRKTYATFFQQQPQRKETQDRKQIHIEYHNQTQKLIIKTNLSKEQTHKNKTEKTILSIPNGIRTIDIQKK